MQSQQIRLLALGLLEIRALLSGYLGSSNDAPMSVRAAAHIAYALHNEADAILKNTDYDLEQAIGKVSAIDQILGVSAGSSLLKQLGSEAEPPA